MLQHEITPFADAHIEALRNVRSGLAIAATPPGDNVIITMADVLRWEAAIKRAEAALTRFKICAEDEWKQKERYRTYAKAHGYPYS